jgi:hypothetical protein
LNGEAFAASWHRLVPQLPGKNGHSHPFFALFFFVVSSSFLSPSTILWQSQRVARLCRQIIQ